MMRRSTVRIKPVAINKGGRVVKVDEERSAFLPTVIEASIDGLDYDVEFVVVNLSDFETPVIADLRITMKHPPERPVPISPEMVRGIRLGEAMRQAVELATISLRPTGPDAYDLLPAAGDANSTRAAYRKRRTVTTEDVRRAAEIYRRLAGDGRRDVLLGVASEMSVSRATAARYVKRAREMGIVVEGDE